MGDIHYLKELPTTPDIVWDSDAMRITIPDMILARIGDYTRSSPTAPSAGRIYKKRVNWRHLDEEPVWIVYRVENDPDDPHYQLHHPYLRWTMSAEEERAQEIAELQAEIETALNGLQKMYVELATLVAADFPLDEDKKNG